MAGAAWWVVARVNRDEALLRALRELIFVVLAGGLAAATVAWSARLSRHREAMRRWRATRAQREAELLKSIATDSADALYAKDLEGRYRFANPAAAALTGVSADHLIGRTDEELHGTEVAERVGERDCQVVQGDRIISYEARFPTPRGERLLHVTKGPLHDGTGRVNGLYAVVRDITETRLAEERLRHSEQRHRLVLASLTEAVMHHDAQGGFVGCNRAAELLLGHDETTLSAEPALLSAWPLFREDGLPLPAHERPLARTLHTGQPCRDLLLGTVGPAGQRRWLRVNTQPVPDPSTGRLAAVVVSCEDQTERHEGELRLRQLSLALAQSPIAVVITDPEGRIGFSNHAFGALSGHGEGVALPERLDEVYAGREPAERLAAARRALSAGAIWQGEFDTWRRDGVVFQERVHAAPVRQPDGRVSHHVWLSEDVSERRRNEAELLRHRERLEELVAERTADLRQVNEELGGARDRAEAASRAKSTFLANMSHEIRTPMNAILGLVHLLQRETRDPSQQRRLAKVDDAARHLLDLLNHILDLSKIEAGRLQLERTSFSLDELLERCAAMVAPRMAEKGLELVIDVDDVPERLQGDPMRLSQMLLNLLSNAAKFTDHGWVQLRVARAGAQSPDQWRFTVSDSGPGITADHQARLFEPFEQGDPTTTRRHGGSGLGLAITRHLASLMGGEMGLNSAVGVGSSFWFTARLSPVVDPLAPALHPLPAAGARQALVADGLPASAEALARALRHAGWQVRTAGSADAVRAVIGDPADLPPELLLVDLDLPGLDGRAGLDRLRDAVAALAGRRPRCIALSRRDVPGGPADGEAVLVKPVTPWQLARRIAPAPVRLPATSGLVPVDASRATRRATTAAAAGPDALPADGAPPPEGEDVEWLRRHQRGARILLVEDNPVNQEVGRELLERAGLSVTLADDGRAALQRLQHEHYALVLMDVQMPGMDGLTATRALRRMPQCARLPVLAMTANAFGEDRLECLAAGMDDHVAKPVDPRLLYAAVRRWLAPRPADEA